MVQRRWLTLGAFLLCFVGVFVLPFLPAPLRYLWLTTPALLVTAMIYEGFAPFGVKFGRRLRLAFARLMG
jgi:hypothetical protein